MKRVRMTFDSFLYLSNISSTDRQEANRRMVRRLLPDAERDTPLMDNASKRDIEQVFGRASRHERGLNGG